MTLRLSTLYETKIQEIFNDYESAMKYKLFIAPKLMQSIYYSIVWLFLFFHLTKEIIVLTITKECCE